MAKFQSIANFCKKPAFILGLILAGFFLKEMFLSAILPFFSGVDEYRHYNTIQYLNEPKEKTWPIEEKKGRFSRSDFESNHFSEEIIQTGEAMGIEAIWSDKLHFFDGYTGENEEEINSHKWDPHNKNYPPDIVGNPGLYHRLAASIENFFSEESILIRFYAIRILSIIFGTLTIFFVYFLLKALGFSRKNSLFISAIISLQPRFSIYITNINYDSLLILIFTLFTLGGVLILKNGPSWKNCLLIMTSFALGILTKGTSIVLLVPLFALVAFFVIQKIKERKINFKYVLVAFLALVLASGIFFSKYNIKTIALPENKDLPAATFLARSLHRIPATSTDYWGGISWTRDNYSNEFVKVIWVIEILSTAGILFYLFSKRRLEFLPEKKYILFFLLLLLALQIGVRFNNWRITASGSELLYGTPGRYFIPNLAVHMAIIFTGLGMLARKKKYFDTVLLAGLVFMLAFSLHIIFNVIIPRFYL